MATPRKKKSNPTEKQVTRYTYDVLEPRTPETGHTALLPTDEQHVTLPMDNGWTEALQVERLEDGRAVVLDMDPLVDPVLLWSGKRNKRDIPVLPLQRNEIVSESRIAQIIERARRKAAEEQPEDGQLSMFGDLAKSLRDKEKDRRVEFYTHEEAWRNRLICGDSLQVMESLLHYEGMAGQVQMIYVDPPYGVKYNSNFQQRVDSTSNAQDDEADDVLTIRAYRDTWTLGIHSYLSHLSERLYLARQLLSETGSIFLQISKDRAHEVRTLLDEVFGAQNFCAEIVFVKTTGAGSPSGGTTLLPETYDCLLWYAKSKPVVKYYQLYRRKALGQIGASQYNLVELADGTIRKITDAELADPDTLPKDARVLCHGDLTSQSSGDTTTFDIEIGGKRYRPGTGGWKTNRDGITRLIQASRILPIGKTLRYKRYFTDFPVSPVTDLWLDTIISGFGEPKQFVVYTNPQVIERCMLMTTDPGDLVFDPTCGSGTTAVCAERLGRRWITCDTSRVAVNVSRRRLLSHTYPLFRTSGSTPSSGLTYETVQRVTLASIARGQEPERVELRDAPVIDDSAIRVTGPFEVLTLGRYSAEDWKGYVSEGGKLENYVKVICRLYRKGASVQDTGGLVHALAESEDEKIAISVGPLSGRVTAKQINDAVMDAMACGYLELHVLGWAFEANVGEIKDRLEARGRVKIQLVMIRPDTLAEGLKATQPEMLFSPLALPDIGISRKNGTACVSLKGVGVFDRKHRATDYKAADSGYVAAWYLDEDYDGDCFVDSQMFFDFAKAPNLRAALKVEIEPEEYRLQLTSEPFPVRGYRRIAVKVVDVFGNESTVVRDL